MFLFSIIVLILATDLETEYSCPVSRRSVMKPVAEVVDASRLNMAAGLQGRGEVSCVVFLMLFHLSKFTFRPSRK